MNGFVRCFIQDKEKIRNYGRRKMFKDKETQRERRKKLKEMRYGK